MHLILNRKRPLRRSLRSSNPSRRNCCSCMLRHLSPQKYPYPYLMDEQRRRTVLTKHFRVTGSPYAMGGHCIVLKSGASWISISVLFGANTAFQCFSCKRRKPEAWDTSSTGLVMLLGEKVQDSLHPSENTMRSLS